jgi:hypothetical protein
MRQKGPLVIPSVGKDLYHTPTPGIHGFSALHNLTCSVFLHFATDVEHGLISDSQ